MKATYKMIPSYYKFIKLKKGYLYYLSNKLDELKKIELLKKYNNIEFYKIQHEYAPEIIVDAILIKN